MANEAAQAAISVENFIVSRYFVASEDFGLRI